MYVRKIYEEAFWPRIQIWKENEENLSISNTYKKLTIILNIFMITLCKENVNLSENGIFIFLWLMFYVNIYIFVKCLY